MPETENDNQAVLVLENITIRVRDTFLFSQTYWTIEKSQNWAIIGPNGAGKTTLAAAIAGELPIVAGKISYPQFKSPLNQVSYLSFESHQRLIAKDEALDASRYFSNKPDSLTTTRDVIPGALSPPVVPGPQNETGILAGFEIEALLDRPIRFLSTGEIRKVLIARALVKSPRLLILDEPFEGLDVQSRDRLTEIIRELMNRGTQIVLVTHRLGEIIPGITHILGVSNGQIVFRGKREEILTDEALEQLYPATTMNLSTVPVVTDRRQNKGGKPPAQLVSFHGVCVKYGKTKVLDNLNWTLNSGENWAIVGPNGSGKTTLLSLIAGDNPQAYSNRIFLFGKRRGTGESIWEIKQNIGLISSEFQIRYRKAITTFEVVLSGFFDSVGLYRLSSPAQQETARKWMALLGITDAGDRRFNTLSYGQQRLALLARAMVKSPPLLILDEPCQGLDRPTRQVMLDLLDYIGRRTTSTLIYVSHHQQERPACITHLLRFVKTKSGRYTAVQENLAS